MNPPRNELTFGGQRDERFRLAEMRNGFAVTAKFRCERAADRVEEVVGFERAAAGDGVECVKAGL